MKITKNNKILLIGLAIFISLMTIVGVVNTKDIKSVVGIVTSFADDYNDVDIVIEEAELVRVVDGDTLVVSIDGKEKKLRMLEIDCPESVSIDEKRNTKEGIEAHHFTDNLLKNVKTLYLTKDKSDTDKYGRILRLVWLDKPNDIFDEKELREKCVNAIILLSGHAKVVKYDDKAYIKIFKKFEKEAKQRINN